MKTDDEVAKEKDAVAKMIGAKSAMEMAIRRIERLEAAMKYLCDMVEDTTKKIGDGLYINTYYHGISGKSESSCVSLNIALRGAVTKAKANL